VIGKPNEKNVFLQILKLVKERIGTVANAQSVKLRRPGTLSGLDTSGGAESVGWSLIKRRSLDESF
jgi:hypothetical protein